MQLFVDNLTNVDFSYLDAKRGLVGETWLASIRLDGSLDSQGMVVDFGIVKKTLRQWLDDILDHRLLIPSRSQQLQLGSAPSQAQHTQFTWQTEHGHIQCLSPDCALTFIDAEAITPASVAAWSQQQLANTFPQTVEALNLNFLCEEIATPYYHYSHGLKKHAGNCQRIAHGHRSRLHIWINDELNHEQMEKWAKKWQDIYIGTVEDQCPASREDYLAFQYSAQQGDFYLELPASQCDLIPTDSTVEWIAHFIAKQLKAQHTQDKIKVQAFEGLGKGAIVEL